MSVSKEYIEKLNKERDETWRYVDAYIARIKESLPPITEKRMRNNWLTHPIVTRILKGLTLKEDIEKNP